MKGGFNCYFPMPFHEGARITLESAHDEDVMLFYQIDYSEETVADDVADRVAGHHCEHGGRAS